MATPINYADITDGMKIRATINISATDGGEDPMAAIEEWVSVVDGVVTGIGSTMTWWDPATPPDPSWVTSYELLDSGLAGAPPPPEGSVVIDQAGVAWQRTSDGWVTGGSTETLDWVSLGSVTLLLDTSESSSSSSSV